MKIKASYQTVQEPPPYAFAYTLEIEIREKEVLVDMQTEYLGREELSFEEIEAEGFSDDDDSHWKVHLPESWINKIHEILDSLKLSASHDDNPSEILFLEIEDIRYVSPSKAIDTLSIITYHTNILMYSCQHFGE